MAHLSDIDFPDFPGDSGEVNVGVIIGAEQAHLWMTGERRQGARGLPMGVSTALGWGLIGPKQLSVAHASCHCLSFVDQQAEINRDVEKVFARDFEPVDEEKEAMSLEDKFALRQMEESIRWDPAVGRYRVALPWKEGREAAAAVLNRLDSDRMALDRLERLARKMRREPER